MFLELIKLDFFIAHAVALLYFFQQLLTNMFHMRSTVTKIMEKLLNKFMIYLSNVTMRLAFIITFG